MVIVCILIFIYLCIPLNQVEFKTSTITYYIPVTLESQKKFNFKSLLSEPFKKTFILRFSIILAIIVATLSGTFIYLGFLFK